jgi:hypothetical protein
MFHWLKKRLAAWTEDHQRREIARLQQESKRLTREIEQTTVEPFRLTREELRRLAEKAKGIDPDRLKQIVSLDPENLAKLIEEIDSAENQ